MLTPNVNAEHENVNVNDLPEPIEPVIFPIVDFEGSGKKELGFVEVVFMLQLRYDKCKTDEERTNVQKGVWFYERSAQMRRHFKREYPEFFAATDDFAAAKKRKERAEEAKRVKRERIRRGRVSADRPGIVDISAYRK